MVEKLDPAFNRCQYCGEVFFAGAGKNTARGFICEQGRVSVKRPLKNEFGGFMAKQKRQCKECSLCETINGLTRCHLGGGEPSVVFPDNTACKMRVIPAKQ